MKIIILDSIGTRDLVTEKVPLVTKDDQGNVTLDVVTNMYTANLQIVLSPDDLVSIFDLIAEKTCS